MSQEKRELICIGCPMGCPMTVTLEDGAFVSVTGNTCPRGAAYAEKEVTDPRRMVTTTVTVTGGTEVRLPVRTKTDVPKGRIFDVLEALKSVSVPAPVAVGQVVLADAAGSGVDVIAARDVAKV